MPRALIYSQWEMGEFQQPSKHPSATKVVSDPNPKSNAVSIHLMFSVEAFAHSAVPSSTSPQRGHSSSNVGRNSRASDPVPPIKADSRLEFGDGPNKHRPIICLQFALFFFTVSTLPCQAIPSMMPCYPGGALRPSELYPRPMVCIAIEMFVDMRPV